jgi:hypothetical protein
LLKVVLVGVMFEPEEGKNKTVAPLAKNEPLITIDEVEPELLSIKDVSILVMLGGVSIILNSVPS